MVIWRCKNNLCWKKNPLKQCNLLIYKTKRGIRITNTIIKIKRVKWIEKITENLKIGGKEEKR